MAIKPINLTLDNKNNNRPLSTSVAFKGGFPNPIVATMDGITRGGFAASFVTQDMLGMAAPRISTGLNRNREETGRYNWKFAKSEAYREILSGPSTFVIPALILIGSGKLVGTATKIPSGLIKDLGEDFAEFAKTQPTAVLANKTALKEGYYEHSIKNILAGSTHNRLKGEKLNEFAKTYASRLIEIENRSNRPISKKLSDYFKATGNTFRNLFQKKENRVANTTTKSMTEVLISDFITLKKKHATASDDVIGAKFKNGKMQVPFQDFLNHLQNYTKDAANSVAKKFKSGSKQKIEQFIEQFTHKRIGARFITTLAMTTTVIAFFTYVPKLYKSKDGKNHALDGLVTQEPKVEVK